MNLVMMGTGSFAEPTFRKLLESPHPVVGLVTQPDRTTGKERGSTRQARQGMKEIALERGIPVLQPESINTPAGVESLKQLQPDLLVVAAYGQILSKDVLGVAPSGGINVHASLLPKYRGAAPINWAIYHGETQSGVTIIRMSIALDAGDILAQEALAILPDETAGELEARFGAAGRAAGGGNNRQIGARPGARSAAGQEPGYQGAKADEGAWADRLVPLGRRGLQSDPRHAALADGVYVSCIRAGPRAVAADRASSPPLTLSELP